MKIASILFNLYDISIATGVKRIVYTVANIISMAIAFLIFHFGKYLMGVVSIVGNVICFISLIYIAFCLLKQIYIFIVSLVRMFSDEEIISNLLNMILTDILLCIIAFEFLGVISIGLL